MDPFFSPPDLGRHARLVQLSPLEAARTFFDGAFYPSDEPALCFAIRKHPGVDLDDDALIDAIFDALDDGLDAEAFLSRLASRS